MGSGWPRRATRRNYMNGCLVSVTRCCRHCIGKEGHSIFTFELVAPLCSRRSVKSIHSVNGKSLWAPKAFWRGEEHSVTGFLCSPGWNRSHDPPASASWMLGLWTCTAMPSSPEFWLEQKALVNPSTTEKEIWSTSCSIHLECIG